jgi:hypothetical protein
LKGVHDWYRFGLLLFPAFNSDTDPDAWLNVYWLLAGISLLSFDFFSLGLKIKQKSQVDLADDFKEMFLFAKLLTIVFVISAFLFVMIEQGISGCPLLMIRYCIWRISVL